MQFPQSIILLKSAVAFVLAVNLTTTAFAANSFPPLSEQSDYQAARVDPNEPELSIPFPGAALHKGMGEGDALVSVAVDPEGRVSDILLVGCSDRAFGRALLDWAGSLKFQPARYQGVAVAGRCSVGYRFEYRLASSCEHKFGFSAWGTTTGGMVAGTAMTADVFEQLSGKALRGADAYAPKLETNLDGPLEFTEAYLPKLPVGYAVPAEKPVKVLVTFYIDEEGKIRQPQVESAAAPVLIPAALRAVQRWHFKPATVKGRPALVYTARSVGFFPRDYSVAAAQ